MMFDAEYLTRLRERDPETCTSFVTSLTPALEGWLRTQFRDYGSIEDVRNETFYRVFRLVDRERVRKPAQLSSFVRGVCDRVARETRRKVRFAEQLPEDGIEIIDQAASIDSLLASQEIHARLRRELLRLRESDRKLLMELHFEERDRREMARERGLTASGLNVRLCRAIKRLRARMEGEEVVVIPARKTCRRAGRVRRRFEVPRKLAA